MRCACMHQSPKLKIFFAIFRFLPYPCRSVNHVQKKPAEVRGQSLRSQDGDRDAPGAHAGSQVQNRAYPGVQANQHRPSGVCQPSQKPPRIPKCPRAPVDPCRRNRPLTSLCRVLRRRRAGLLLLCLLAVPARLPRRRLHQQDRELLRLPVRLRLLLLSSVRELLVLRAGDRLDLLQAGARGRCLRRRLVHHVQPVRAVLLLRGRVRAPVHRSGAVRCRSPWHHLLRPQGGSEKYAYPKEDKHRPPRSSSLQQLMTTQTVDYIAIPCRSPPHPLCLPHQHVLGAGGRVRA